MNSFDNCQTSILTEGRTQLVVPSNSLIDRVPSKTPAFFNPAARLSRDLSIVAYNAFSDQLKQIKSDSFADAFAGVGSRGIRVAVEVPAIGRVCLNDANPVAISLAQKAAEINSVSGKCCFSVNEVCRFLMEGPTSPRELDKDRFGIVDLDPFGTPAKHIDCVLRAVADGGLVSITATDTAVLCGIYPEVCLRRYYGRPLNTEYGNEVALRLMISLIAVTASRLELSISPLFCHATMHYLRVYAKVEVSSSKANSTFGNLGCILHCSKCRNRLTARDPCPSKCNICDGKLSIGGPIWSSQIIDEEFAKRMSELTSDRQCSKIINTSVSELKGLPYYFTVDEIAKTLKKNPSSVTETVEKLRLSGFVASGTSLNTRGFKTDASLAEICQTLR